MKKIRVTRGGCGICYTDANGVKRHALKTPENGAFECGDEQADRLVRLGVAAYVGSTEKPAQQADADLDQTEEPEQTVKGHLSAEDLEGWDYNELKKLAAEMGLEVKGKKKADYIAAITAEEVKASAEDDELPPDLDVVDPE